MTNFFLRYIQKNMVFIDVGEHVGFYSMLSVLVDCKGRVHSFEPTPWKYTLLKKNTKELKNVTCNNLVITESLRFNVITNNLKYENHNLR